MSKDSKEKTKPSFTSEVKSKFKREDNSKVPTATILSNAHTASNVHTTSNEYIESNAYTESNVRTASTVSTAEEVLSTLKKSGFLYRDYLKMSERWRERFLAFCTGKKTLPLLYDSTFKLIFNPEIHKNRLDSFLSEILGEKVEVKEILLPEDSMIAGENIVIMDIIVQLEDGSIADVEIQKDPYKFPGERISCYSSDIVMRQYTRVKSAMGTGFNYSGLSKVHTIVIYEKTSSKLPNIDSSYIHHGKVTFDTNLKLNMLQEYHLICLDIFKETAYHKEISNLAGWLTLLVTEDMDDVDYVIDTYPWLKEIYEEIALYRGNIQGVVSMYSQMFQETDESSLKYMVDILQEEINEQKEQLASKDEQLVSQAEQLTSQAEQLANKDEQLANKDAEIAALKELLEKSKH